MASDARISLHPIKKEMHVETWPIDRPIPYARNARKIPQTAIDKVAASIKEFGWRQPIVVDAVGVIVAGHTRLLGARKLGLAEVPVHVAHGLTPAQVKAYRLMDNRSHQEAAWDVDLLGLELLEIRGMDDFDLSLTGFDYRELGDLLERPGVADAPAQTEKAAALQRKWGTKSGQLWNVGSHRLLIGDSGSVDDRERLLAGDSVDLVCTDPPYELDVETVAATMALYAPRAVVLAGSKIAFGLGAQWDFRLDFIWRHKSPRMGMAVAGGRAPLLYHAHVVILCVDAKTKTGWRRPDSKFGSVFDEEYEDKSGFGQGKPASLFAKMLKGFRDWKKVADPYCGTGASILACESQGRQCFAMEVSPEHAAVALQRCSDAGLQANLS